MKGNPHIIHPSIGDRRDDRCVQSDFPLLIRPTSSNPVSGQLSDSRPSGSCASARRGLCGTRASVAALVIIGVALIVLAPAKQSGELASAAGASPVAG